MLRLYEAVSGILRIVFLIGRGSIVGSGWFLRGRGRKVFL
jgi:hypothetical protein